MSSPCYVRWLMRECGQAPVTDLLCGAETLAERLGEALRDEQWLDAYLFAAGLGQLFEDRLHADPFLFYRAASYLRGLSSRQARLVAAAAEGLGTLTRAGASHASRRLKLAQRPLTALTSRLAEQVIAPQRPGELAPLLRAVTRAVPQVAGDRLRIPTCFHSFDQHPDDVRWLAVAFRERHPDPGGPLCVVGVRTSGSYLAPLLAAALRVGGEPRVAVLTYRPGRPFLARERATLRAVARAGGWILVTDDPPGTGNSLAATARAIARTGVPASRIMFLVSLFGSDEQLPEVLRAWPCVVQPWTQWSVHHRLATSSVRQALASMVGPDVEVREVQSAAAPCAAGGRRHVRARFTVLLSDRRTGAEVRRNILVEGAGIGYFGRQGVAVAGAISDHVPHVYGFAEGLIFRDWLPPVPHPVPSAALADRVAAYVDARRRALPAPSGSVDGLGGRDPVWEVAAKVLSGQYGPLGVPARPLLLEPVVRRLLAHEHPTVLDGKTDARHWLPDHGSAGELRKVDFYQRAFGHLDLACYDPVFDLAGAAADPPAPGFEEQLRRAYQRMSGERVDGERWLLYRLAQLWRLGQAGDLARLDVQQRSAAAVHDYLAALYLGGLTPASGPLCAIDLDGVLECDRLGFPATSPTGVLALRSLIAHGYRPVLASGRSMSEVRDRCQVFGLAGGVAEYGAAVYGDGESVDLRPPESRVLIDRIRHQLSCRDGVQLDPRYRYAVRARSRSGPLRPEQIAEVPALADPGVRIVHGDGQTDITVTGVDKGSGLRALAARLSDPGCVLAVGDSPADIPLLTQTPLARAPRNARLGDGGTGIQRTRHAYQAGLTEACTDLLGHRPGRCPTCRAPAFAPRTRAMLAILDLRAAGLATIGTRTAVLGALRMAGPRW